MMWAGWVCVGSVCSAVLFCCHGCCCGQALIRYCPSLDDPLPLFLARAYAINHPAMHLNSNDTTGFVQGTVQGAQWYTLLGGMQVRRCLWEAHEGTWSCVAMGRGSANCGHAAKGAMVHAARRRAGAVLFV